MPSQERTNVTIDHLFLKERIVHQTVRQEKMKCVVQLPLGKRNLDNNCLKLENEIVLLRLISAHKWLSQMVFEE